MCTQKQERCAHKAKLGNQNAAGMEHLKEIRTQKKYGFFSKYLPDETREIFSAIEQADPLDLLWHQRDTACL